jgi:hypothetical protein
MMRVRVVPCTQGGVPRVRRVPAHGAVSAKSLRPVHRAMHRATTMTRGVELP